MFKKIILQIFIILSLLCLIYPNISFAGVVKNINNSDVINVSIDPNGGELMEGINDTGYSLLGSIKTILLGVFIFFMVYAGAKMIMSMGTDEEKIKSAKRQIWYSLIGVIFISIPGAIYEAFFNNGEKNGTSTNWSDDGIGTIVGPSFSIFFNYIVGLLEILIFFIALFIFIFTGIKLILGGKDPKTVGEAKTKILYSIIALVLVGFIEVWRGFAFSGDMNVGVGIFATIANLLLFIAPLIGLFFLTLAGYYYITSGGDKEKVKKAKDIIIYIFLGTLIFLASYAILLELNTFTP